MMLNIFNPTIPDNSRQAITRNTLVVGVLFVSSFFAASANAESGAPVLADSGKKLFSLHCATCHGLTGLGDGPAASSLKVAPPNLRHLASKNKGTFAASEVSQFIDGRTAVSAHGSRDMPIWGEALGAGATGNATIKEELTQGKIAALVEYLREIQEPGPSK